MSGPFHERVLTSLGEVPLYDGVSQCSRCGYCEQACPTYVVSGKEPYNPRGRNQLFRMTLEGKLKDPAAAEESFSTCLLCGACMTACYAHVRTPEFVLEGRRRIRGGKAPWLARFLTGLLDRRPAVLSWLLRAAHLLKRLGLARLACALRLPTLAGLKGLETAERHVRTAPLRFLHERLRGRTDLKGSNWTYFSPCGPNYLYPRVGLATVQALKERRGEGRYLGNVCCGLLAYNYGELDEARRAARKVIERYEWGGTGPVVADCSSCTAHLKSYEQLFIEEPEWRERAKAFSGRVQDAIEALAGEEEPLEPGSGVRVTYHDSCRARHGQGISQEPRTILRALLKDRFVELPEADWCCGGAGAFAFVQPELSESILRRKISNIASTQADLVLTSSTSCLLQLEYGLRKYYPEASVQHLSEFLAAPKKK